MSAAQPSGAWRNVTQERLPVEKTGPIEWPTLCLVLAVYAAWLIIFAYATVWPLWLVAPLGALLVAWHSSLQHEILHGHPTRWRAANTALGIVPLSLWLPYRRYQQLHLRHHVDDRLTDPLDDPESFYLTDDDWSRCGPIQRLMLRAQASLAGRVVLGPFWSIARFLFDEARLVAQDAPGLRRIWLEHLAWCAPVAVYVTFAAGMPLWLYGVAVLFPATSISMVRSFAEHRAGKDAAHRVAIVEGAWLLGPLFLFNNLHALHHERPQIPWYRYPRWYRENRDRLIRQNGGLVYAGYLDVARRFLLSPHDEVRHPADRVSRGGADAAVAQSVQT